MKKNIIFSSIIFGCMLALPLSTIGQVRIGAGLTYGTDVEELGLLFRGEYFWGEYFSTSATLNLFPRNELSSSQAGTTLSKKVTSLDLDAKYMLEINDLVLYPLVGPNFYFESSEENNNNDTEWFIGLNAGAGTRFSLADWLEGFGEVKYIFNKGVGQVMFSGGLLVVIGD